MLELVFLIAVNGIDQIVRKVVPEMQLVADEERTGRELSFSQRLVDVERQARAPRTAAVGGIERAEAIGHQPLGNGAQRNVGGVGPELMIDLGSDRITVRIAAFAVTKQHIFLAPIVRGDEGPIVVLHLGGGQQPSIAQRLRSGAENTLKTQGSHRRRDLVWNGVAIIDVHRTHRAEVAHAGIVRSLGVGDSIRQFRNQEIQIGVTLTMGMRGLVDRHAIDVGSQISAMIEVVAAQQILIGLALTAMRGHDQSGHGLEQLPRTVLRCQLQFLIVDHPFTGRRCRPQQFQPLRSHRDLLYRRR